MSSTLGLPQITICFKHCSAKFLLFKSLAAVENVWKIASYIKQSGFQQSTGKGVGLIRRKVSTSYQTTMLVAAIWASSVLGTCEAQAIMLGAETNDIKTQ